MSGTRPTFEAPADGDKRVRVQVLPPVHTHDRGRHDAAALTDEIVALMNAELDRIGRETQPCTA